MSNNHGDELSDDRFVEQHDDDEPNFDELDLDAADSVFDAGDSIAALAARQRAWRFGHVIVDEAQDLSPMQWRMVARRARRNSMTIVGDLAQRSSGAADPESVQRWSDVLPPSIDDFAYRELTINYRSPAEMDPLAAALLGEIAPDLIAATSIRHAGSAPRAIACSNIAAVLPALIAEERAALGEGKVAVITSPQHQPDLAERELAGAQMLTARAAKGLEFDSVIIVEPTEILDEPFGPSLLYVAVTRSTKRLTLLHTRDLPPVLAEVLDR